MRLLVVTPDFPPAYGGIQVLIERLARHLDRHDVTVLAPSPAAQPDPPAPYRVIGVRAPERRAGLLTLDLMLPLVAARLRPDAVISGHIVCGPGALLARRLTGAPIIQYVYALELTARPRLSWYVLPRVDATVAIGAYSERLALSAGATPGRTNIVPPGVEPPGPQRSPGTEPIILTISRMENEYKGFDVMLRAMPLVAAKVPGFRWVVIGDGRLRATLAEQASAAGCAENVVFTGSLSDQERDRWLARARLFAMPSRVPVSSAGEGFGIVFLEAGRFGVPSVTANEGGAADAVIDGVTGLQVDPRDHVALAGAMLRLLTDDGLHRACADGALLRAELLSWQRMADGVEAIAERLISR